MYCKKHKLQHSTLTHRTTLQNLFAPFCGKIASLYVWHWSATSCSIMMTQTALSGASTCFTPTPLRKTSEAASLNERTFTWCVTQRFGAQQWQKSSLHCVWVPPSLPVWKKKKKRLPAKPNVPGTLSHQCLGCHQPGRWQIVGQLCMHYVPRDTLSLHRYQIRFWLEGMHRLVTLLPPSYQQSQGTPAHKYERMRAKSMLKCQGVVGRKSELLSITLSAALWSEQPG